MFQKDLQLTDLVNLDEWQKIQDSFSEVLEVTLRTISLDGELISRPSRPSSLCADILPESSHCSLKEIKDYILSTTKKEGHFKCLFGLDVFVVPIMAVGNRVAAYMLLGPVILKGRKERSEYVKDAERLGIDAEDLIDSLIEINVFSYNKVYSMINLIKDTFSHMAQVGYHKKRLGEIAPEVVELDPLFSRYYEEKMLNALLKSCVLLLGADSGSVMTLDKKTNMLHIKVASKLDKDIIKNTHVRIGEGIAGMAAQTARPIILPKDQDKNGLSDKMTRKYIKSSMIVPFSKGNTHEVYGVINLNMMRKDTDFSDRDIELVKELVNMASIALIPLQQSTPGSTTTA